MKRKTLPLKHFRNRQPQNINRDSTPMKITIKPVRRCTDCGHLIPLHRVICPYCNGEIKAFGKPPVENYDEGVPIKMPDYSFLKNHLRVILGGILALAILLLLIFVIPWGGNKSTSPSKTEVNEISSNNIEPVAQQMNWNGNFIIKGRSYPVRLEFEEKNDEIINCTYTNVSQGGIQMPMTGTKNGELYTFNGHDGANPLVINVRETYSGHYEGFASGQFEATAIFNRESSSSETQEITFDGFHSFSGHNGANVNGEITVNGSEVTGRERYKSSYLPLSGYYDPESGQLEMTEYNGNMITGSYEGYVNGMEFHGTFTNFKGRTYNATLHFQ